MKSCAKRARDDILSFVALPRCPRTSQSTISQWGWDFTLWGAVSTREVIVIVPALLELYRFGGFVNPGWSRTSPVCDGTAPRMWASVLLGRRCGARTSQQRSANRIGLSTWCPAVSTRTNSIFLHGFRHFLRFWAGDWTLFARAELVPYTSPRQ